jgi:hypothetical protein
MDWMNEKSPLFALLLLVNLGYRRVHLILFQSNSGFGRGSNFFDKIWDEKFWFSSEL